MNEIIQVVTTVDAKDKAQDLARHLVKLRLAACVQIDGPLESIYRWEGEIDTSSEWRLTVKTRRGVYNEVEDAIRGWHDYEVPEILAVSVVIGSVKYIQWLNEQVADNPLR